jgi:hypothetical protein
MEVPMEKVSSILPSKARITSVDTEGAQPARPGAPAFGRPKGTVSIGDRATISARAKEMAAKETLLGRSGKEASRAKAVDEINRRFFETRLQKPEPIAVPISEQIADNLEEAEETISYKEPMVSPYEESNQPQTQPRLSVEV